MTKYKSFTHLSQSYHDCVNDHQRSKKARLIIQTGDQRPYANIILVKGVVE